MDNNIINDDIIEKVVIKSVSIYKAMSVLPTPPFEDKFLNKQDICQQNENIQKQSLEKCLRETEPSKENEIIDTTNDIKKSLEKKSWKDITNPKERQKAYRKIYREYNKDKISKQTKAYKKNNKDKIKEQRNAYLEANKDKIKLQKEVYWENNKEKLNLKNKAYNKDNKHKIKVYRKNWAEDNKEKLKIHQKTYLEANKDKIKLQKKAYYEFNREKLRFQKNNYSKNRKKTDIQFKLSCNLRSRLHSAINGNFKAGSAVRDLGCTIEELKQHLESKFQPGMTWDNWSDVGWHIDHIKPLASFDLTDRKQFLEACHYTNLQPLWAKDNLIKSDKLV